MALWGPNFGKLKSGFSFRGGGGGGVGGGLSGLKFQRGDL